jgi:hypothetical protein
VIGLIELNSRLAPDERHAPSRVRPDHAGACSLSNRRSTSEKNGSDKTPPASLDAGIEMLKW